ncbi:MAG: hypothetical protein ACK4UJ_07440 [Leptonema sp. (in: bacteria)]
MCLVQLYKNKVVAKFCIFLNFFGKKKANLCINHYMEHSDQKEFKKKHVFCINIKSELILSLDRLSRGDWSSFLVYLYEKYKNRLLYLRNRGGGVGVAEYQPQGEEYKKVKIRGMDPLVWQRYWELRMLSGYSISYIIRVFLEWELLGRGEEIRTILPAVGMDDERLGYRYPDGYRVAHRYIVRRELNGQDRSLFLYYWDDA